MGRLWSSGFGLNSTGSQVEWAATSGSPTIQTSVVRSGTYAGQINSLSSGTIKGFFSRIGTGNATGPYFVRFYFYYSTLPSADNTIFSWQETTLTDRIYIKLSSTGTLKLFDEDGQIGSASSALSSATWYRIEIKADLSGSAGSHVVEAMIDGSAFATSSTRSISTGIKWYIIGGNLLSESQTTGNWYFDDLAINDNTGSFQNSYPGAGNIIYLRPSAAGDANSFATQTGGTAGSSNNYTRVNEVTPDDATTFNGSNTTNQEDLFNVDDSGIGSGDAINVVQVGLRFRNNTADASTTVKLEAEKTSGGTIAQSSGISPNTTTWSTNTATGLNTHKNYPLTLHQDPDNSNWTQSTVDSMQIGYKITTGGTNRIDVSTLWAIVDYTPTIAFSVSVSDSSTVSESINSYSDNIFLRESYGLTLVSDVSKSESVAVSESVSLLTESYINKNESISVADSSAVNLVVGINKSESVTVSESTTFLVESYINKSESITVAESVTVTVLAPGGQINVSDSIAISESTNINVEVARSVSESVSIAESIKLLVESYVNKPEAISVAENAATDIVIGALASEAVSVTELVSRMLESYINKSEAVGVADNAILEVNSFISKSESITVVESVSAFLPHLAINVYETVSVAEAISFSLVAFSFTDNISVSESVNVYIVLITTDSVMSLKAEDPSVVPLNASTDSLMALH